MYHISTLDNISKTGLAHFNDNYDLTAAPEAAEGILVRSHDMHSLFEDPSSLPLLCVARAGAGVNNIPLDAFRDAGIIVFNTPGANANAVKEQVIASLLLASRDLIGGNQWVATHAEDPEISKSAEKAKKAFVGTEIMGKKLGVIGLGAIGQLVANAASALGMDVYGYDPFLSVNAAWNLSRKIHHIDDLHEIFRNCDYITLHVPATNDTRGMINAEAFGLMKDGVVIINCARDVLVDEPALAAALESGKLRKYVTDFATPEIVHLPGVIVFPHLGASTEEAEENCAVMAVDQMRDYLENGNITHAVNFPDCDAGKRRTACRLVVLHKNIPDTLSKITSGLGKKGINIESLNNKSKGDVAVSILDTDAVPADDVLSEINQIDGLLRLRVL